MLRFLPGPLAGCIGILFLATHTALAGGSILLLTPLKLLLRPFRLDTKLIGLMRFPFHIWYKTIHFYFGLLGNVEMDIHLPPKEDLNPELSGLLISNHQSWLDIPLLLSVLRNRLSSPTFFLKKELLYVPLIGSSAWAMDMIFVHRITRKELRKNPSLKGKDIETAKRKCRKLKNYPTSFINFCEGTRITEEKYNKSAKRYRHLLAPKAGGANFTLNAMEGKLKHFVDVTIVYHSARQSHILWDFVCCRIPKISFYARVIPIGEDMYGDYNNDPAYKQNFQEKLNTIWKEKDELISQIKS
jgi:1-acyl-sn-glycerol-3-phosphate acyltransferase